MRCLTAVLLIATSLSASAAPVPKDPPKNADRVVGVWKIVKSDTPTPEGRQAEVEFTADGKLELRVEFAGGRTVRKGTYKVEGDKIKYELSTDNGVRGETLVIKSIAADDMVTEDPDGKKETFERVKK